MPRQDGQASVTQRPIVTLVLLTVFAAGCAVLGVFEPPFDVPRKLYHVLGLFSHDSEWVFAPATAPAGRAVPWLAVFAPFVSVLAIATLFFNWVRPLWLRWDARIRLLLGVKGVALIGLSEQSLALAVSIRFDRSNRMVPIIVADAGDQGLAAQCQFYGVAVFPRHSRRVMEWLHLPWRRLSGTLPVNRIVGRAWGLVSFLPTAGAQLDLITELHLLATSQSPGRRRDGGAISRAWILLDDRGLAQRLEDPIARLSDRVVPRLLTLNTLRARHLLTSHPLDVLADAFGQPRIHIVIYGFGATGRAIAKEAAQLYVTRPSLTGIKIRISFFDKDAAAAESAFLAEDPGILNVIDLAGRQAAFPPAGLLQTQLCLLPPDITAHVIALGDGASAFNMAASLRRWLLEPPAGNELAQQSHAAPIFVRTPSARGLGQVFRKGRGAVLPAGSKPANPPAPDGIFDFGAIEDLFGAADGELGPATVLLDPDSENGARELHVVYARSRPGLRTATDAGELRAAERTWEALPSSLRESNFRAFDHVAIKARAIGWRFVPARSDVPQNAGVEPADGETLAELEHLRYMAERVANGWRLAPQRLDAVRVHPDLVDWAVLDTAERQIDMIQIDHLPQIAAAARHRLAPALIVGVIGHRPDKLHGGAQSGGRHQPGSTIEDMVRERIRRRLNDLRDMSSERELLVVTALARGTDSLAAEAAQELSIPFMAVFPLPYELYIEDFPERLDRQRFRELAAAAELHVELPLRFGRASDLTTSRQPAPQPNLERRNRQYALAGAYIVERAHELVAVYDGQPGGGTGGTQEVLGWWAGGVPAQYATPSRFFVRPAPNSRPAPFLINPNSVGNAPEREDVRLG